MWGYTRGHVGSSVGLYQGHSVFIERLNATVALHQNGAKHNLAGCYDCICLVTWLELYCSVNMLSSICLCGCVCVCAFVCLRVCPCMCVVCFRVCVYVCVRVRS